MTRIWLLHNYLLDQHKGLKDAISPPKKYFTQLVRKPKKEKKRKEINCQGKIIKLLGIEKHHNLSMPKSRQEDEEEGKISSSHHSKDICGMFPSTTKIWLYQHKRSHIYHSKEARNNHGLTFGI